MIDNLKKLIASLESMVSPEQQTQFANTWVIKDILNCEQSPAECMDGMVGACCLTKDNSSVSQCLENILRTSCETQGGIFYPSKTCADINGSGCGSPNSEMTDQPMPDGMDMMVTPE
jgi:hypothetical protein